MNEIVCPIAMFRKMNDIKVIIAELIKDITENIVNCLLFVIEATSRGMSMRSNVYIKAVVTF